MTERETIMSNTALVRSLFIAALPVLAMATPAAAKTKPVTVPAAVFKTADSKLCMPRHILKPFADKATLKALPDTLCATRAEWEQRGLTFMIK